MKRASQHVKGEAGGIADGAQLLASARLTATAASVAVAQRSDGVIHVDEHDDGIAAAAAKEKHASARQFAKDAWIVLALCGPKHLRWTPPGIPIIHTLAVRREQRGNLNGALARYEEADGSNKKPDRIIGESLARIRHDDQPCQVAESRKLTTPAAARGCKPSASRCYSSPAPAAAPSGRSPR